MTRVLRLALVALFAAPFAALAETTLTADPSPIVLGRTSLAKLTLQLDPALAAVEGPLRVSANVGVVGVPQAQPDGTFSVAYTPPTTKFPQMALLALWREGSTVAVEFVRMPLFGVTKIDASSRAGTEVRARVGDQVFGPMVANAKGQATLSVVVPPGATDTVLLAKVSGVETQRTVELGMPPYNRLAAVLTPSELGPSWTGTARLDVHYDTEDGIDPKRVQISPSAGKVTLESADGSRLRYRYELPAEGHDSATLTVSVDGDKASTLSLSLRREQKMTSSASLAAGELSLVPDLQVGVRLGFTHSLTAMAGPRYGLDVLAPFSLGDIKVALGFLAAYGGANQVVTDLSGTALGRAEIALIPLALRLSLAPVRFLDRGAVIGGAGLSTTLARYQAYDVSGAAMSADAFTASAGLTMFAGATWDFGPGQAFGELVFSWALLENPSFRAQGGGLGLEVGYRFDVLRRR